MSSRLIATSRVLLVLCSFLLAVYMGAAPALAQGLANNVKTTFAIPGVKDTTVVTNGAGETPGGGGTGCPFEDYPGGPNNFIDASNAAKQGGDPDGCPFIIDSYNNKIPVQCFDFYDVMIAVDPTTSPNMHCCMYAPGDARQKCIQSWTSAKTKSNMEMSPFYQELGISPKKPGIFTQKQQTDQDTKNKALADAQNQCFNGTMDKVDLYWGQQRQVKCLNDITKYFKKKVSNATGKAGDQRFTDLLKGWTSGGSTGSAPGVTIPLDPKAVIAANVTAGERAISFGAKLAKIASDLNTALNDCSSIVPGLNQLSAFRNTITSTFSCQGLSNLVLRQLTQCIRINLSLDLSMPQFQLMTQCPINVNISRLGGPSGFKCYNSVSFTSPIAGSASYGGHSLLSGNGGISNLFSPDCFSPSTPTSGGISDTTPATTDNSGTRVPGVDCGPLDTSNPLKNQPYTGINYLAAGTTTDGWAAGGSEPIMQPTSNLDANGKVIMQPTNLVVTRCDFYQTSRQLRTTYVYGSGSNCNTGANGFLDGGFEANTSCYGNNYTPAPAPSIPDACMYPAACLDSSGNFSQSLAGTNGCPAGVAPAFNANASYTVFTSGGLSGGSSTPYSCNQFSGNLQGAIQCCDPSKQDCTKKDANTPLCVCDEGDAQNTVNVDVNGTPDPAGSCVEGGNLTCCSPRLNGGEDNCNAMVGTGHICPDELADQCVGASTSATYTGPDGKTQTVTATDLATAKPSPYIYLFVRPDAEESGQYCCMTEWCNICPQEYANAYGLSMAQSTMSQPTSDAGNAAILGKGWPFMTSTNSYGVSSAQVGVNPLMVPSPQSGMPPLPFYYPPLMIGPDIQNRPLDTALAACNNMSQWKAGYAGDSQFVSGNMGALFNGAGYAQIPTMTETPMAYLNRMRSSMTSGGQPLPPIQLCSDLVKICVPNSGSTPSASNFGTGNANANVTSSSSGVPTSAAPAVVVTPTAATTSAPVAATTSAPAAATTTTAAPTAVPSATNSGGSSSQVPNTLY